MTAASHCRLCGASDTSAWLEKRGFSIRRCGGCGNAFVPDAAVPADLESVYNAGYFGGAVGLLMIAAWRVLGEHDIKSLHGPRTLLVTAANTAAIALLAAAGIVRWTACLPMGAGAMAGGYIGARVGKRLSPRVAHITAIVIRPMAPTVQA